VAVGDLDQGIPWADASFDIVHANQVIEHVSCVDRFCDEIFRVLRPGGCVVVSTENASSWHNVLAAAMGWQIFSLTNFSSRQAGLGNPLALHRREHSNLGSWTHKVVLSYRGLIELLEVAGFEGITVRGAGYYPLPAGVGAIDVRHAHFLAARARKPMVMDGGELGCRAGTKTRS
jgi:SAM-dependent methyltransferase